jgi:hypothetical protein
MSQEHRGTFAALSDRDRHVPMGETLATQCDRHPPVMRSPGLEASASMVTWYCAPDRLSAVRVADMARLGVMYRPVPDALSRGPWG